MTCADPSNRLSDACSTQPMGFDHAQVAPLAGGIFRSLPVFHRHDRGDEPVRRPEGRGRAARRFSRPRRLCLPGNDDLPAKASEGQRARLGGLSASPAFGRGIRASGHRDLDPVGPGADVLQPVGAVGLCPDVAQPQGTGAQARLVLEVTTGNDAASMQGAASSRHGSPSGAVAAEPVARGLIRFAAIVANIAQQGLVRGKFHPVAGTTVLRLGPLAKIAGPRTPQQARRRAVPALATSRRFPQPQRVQALRADPVHAYITRSRPGV